MASTIPLAHLQPALQAYYGRRFPAQRPRISALALLSEGWESEIFSFTLQGGADPVRTCRALVLRLYTGEGAAAKAKREYQVMSRLHRMGFPVPETLLVELDSVPLGQPFIVMERVAGRTLARAMAEAPNVQRWQLTRRFIELYAGLHALDWRSFVADPGSYDPAGFICRWLVWVRGYVEQLGVQGLGPVLAWLDERCPAVGDARLALIHGDYHPNNVLLRDDGALLIIDWTNAEVSDYRFDLAWTLLLTDASSNPAAREARPAEYERIAGHPVEQIEYFEVIACARRLFSIAGSLTHGASRFGMRPGAEAHMRRNTGHIERVYALLRRHTGLHLPEIEALLATLKAP